MTLVTFSQVVARYVFNTGVVWALELTVYLFAWLVLLGMSYGVKVTRTSASTRSPSCSRAARSGCSACSRSRPG